MKNFKLIKNVDTKFIRDELTAAIKDKELSFTLIGSQRTLEERVKYFGKVYISHKDSSWQYLLSPYASTFAHPLDRYSCEGNSKFLYKTPLYKQFPQTVRFLKEVAKEQNAYLQRAVIVQLLPHGDVRPHTDGGEYYKYRNRYHLVLQSTHGSKFASGDEKQVFREGELWWFANKEIHSVKNLGDSPRIHIIFDLLPKKHFNLRQKITNALLGYFFQNYYDVYGKDAFVKLIHTNPFLKETLLSE